MLLIMFFSIAVCLIDYYTVKLEAVETWNNP